MCGIAGSVGYSLPSVNVTGALYKRGPDGSGAAELTAGIEPVNLYHTRLAIIDTSPAGAQPMQHGPITMVMNGEIYNYQDLKKRLSTFPFKSGNDSETALAYIYTFGLDKFLKDAVGMFAAAVYDQNERTISLFVDHTAQKPLYYFHHEKSFGFASSPAALLRIQPHGKLDTDALQAFWALGAPMGEDFLLAGIHKVAAAHVVQLHIQPNRLKKWRYWQPQFQPHAKDMLLHRLEEAIESVKVSDVPVSLFLSGGIDSTVCAMHMGGYKAIHLDGPEASWAQEAADRFGLSLEVVRPGPEDADECVRDYVRQCGHPSGAAIIPYITAKYAAKLGKVAVIANGADELFFGYDRIYSPKVKRNDPIQQRRHAFREWFLDQKIVLGHTINGSNWLKGGDDAANMTDFVKRDYQLDGNFDLSARSRWLELMAFVQYDLNQTLDAASMCHSLEVRSPFLDHRLIECALSLDDTFHLMPEGNKSYLKGILREAGFGDQFIKRPKQGFSLFSEPVGYEALKDEAVEWCKLNGYLPPINFSGRDLAYIRAAAVSFKAWAEIFAPSF